MSFLVEMIGVKNRAYCSVLAEIAKTCVLLGLVKYFKKMRGNPLVYEETFAWEIVSLHFFSAHRHPNLHTTFGKFCQDWTPTAPITQSI